MFGEVAAKPRLVQSLHPRSKLRSILARRINLEKCYEYFQLEHRVEEITKDWDRIFFEVTGTDLHKCPECEDGNMVCLANIDKNLYRPPPATDKTA